MKRIILIRHGESQGNKRLVGGKDKESYVNDCEIGLTELGKKQAKLIAELLIKAYGKFDDYTELWVSPFLRTRQSAEIMNQVLNIRKVYEDPRISEQDFGNFDYQFMDEWKDMSPHSYFVNQMRYNSRHSRFYARLEGGENLADVYSRVSLFDLSRIQPSMNTQILVTHGCFMMAALMYFTGAKIEFAYDYPETISNCCAYILEKDEWQGVYEIKNRIVLTDVLS